MTHTCLSMFNLSILQCNGNVFNMFLLWYRMGQNYIRRGHIHYLICTLGRWYRPVLSLSFLDVCWHPFSCRQTEWGGNTYIKNIMWCHNYGTPKLCSYEFIMWPLFTAVILKYKQVNFLKGMITKILLIVDIKFIKFHND